MEKLPIREISFPAARELAELRGVIADLEYVVHATKKQLELLSQPEHDEVVVRALYTAALITYARCFTDGKRWKLDVSIYESFEGEPVVVHRQLMDTRNKHLAHSVNAYEDYRSGAVLAPNGTEVIGVAYLHTSRATDDLQGVDQLRRLASAAGTYLMNVAKELESEVLKTAQAMSVAQVEALPPLRITPQGGPEAARSVRAT